MQGWGGGCIENFGDFEGGGVGSWRKVRVRAGKIASDVELGASLFFGLGIKKAGRLFWTP